MQVEDTLADEQRTRALFDEKYVSQPLQFAITTTRFQFPSQPIG
jgi:hypothetical protein